MPRAAAVPRSPLAERIAEYLAQHCADPRHPRTKEFHAKAHYKHAKAICTMVYQSPDELSDSAEL